MTTKAADGRRRGRGSGGVQQRDKAGRVWRLWYDAPPGADGKRRRRSETLHGKRVQAEQRLRAILGSIDTGEFVEQTEETTADFKWIVGQAEQLGGWDDTLLSVATKAFDFGTA